MFEYSEVGDEVQQLGDFCLKGRVCLLMIVLILRWCDSAPVIEVWQQIGTADRFQAHLPRGTSTGLRRHKQLYIVTAFRQGTTDGQKPPLATHRRRLYLPPHRYRMHGKPLFTNCCHCRWCQRETGSAFVINAMIGADRVETLGDAPELINTPSDSGGVS